MNDSLSQKKKGGKVYKYKQTYSLSISVTYSFAGILIRKLGEEAKSLFEYNQLLKKLGSKLVKFIDRCHAEKFQCSKDWLEFKELMSLREEFIQRDYKEQVLDKYGIKYSDSVTNAIDIKN